MTDYMKIYGSGAVQPSIQVRQAGGDMGPGAPAPEPGGPAPGGPGGGPDIVAVAEAALAGDPAAKDQFVQMFAPMVLEQAGGQGAPAGDPAPGGGPAPGGPAGPASPGAPVLRRGGNL